MTIAITGASGKFGRLAIEALLRRGVEPTDVVAVVRDSTKVADLADRGVVVRAATYEDPAALKEALGGVDKLLLVSGSAVGQRIDQHANVIRAAADAGVQLIAYTSILDAARSQLALAAEHKATEEILVTSGIPHVLLRNGWYWENYTNDLAGTVDRGVLIGSAGEGRIAGAARADYAEAAAVVLTSDEQEGKVYELGGNERLTYTELAQQISSVGGKAVNYVNLTPTEYVSALEQAGVPAGFAGVLADSDVGAAAGALDTVSGDLQRLLGRASTPVADVLRQALYG
jgi:NAD(P)H dehydrogenase (quinone)